MRGVRIVIAIWRFYGIVMVLQTLAYMLPMIVIVLPQRQPLALIFIILCGLIGLSVAGVFLQSAHRVRAGKRKGLVLDGIGSFGLGALSVLFIFYLESIPSAGNGLTPAVRQLGLLFSLGLALSLCVAGLMCFASDRSYRQWLIGCGPALERAKQFHPAVAAIVANLALECPLKSWVCVAQSLHFVHYLINNRVNLFFIPIAEERGYGITYYEILPTIADEILKSNCNDQSAFLALLSPDGAKLLDRTQLENLISSESEEIQWITLDSCFCYGSLQTERPIRPKVLSELRKIGVFDSSNTRTNATDVCAAKTTLN